MKTLLTAITIVSSLLLVPGNQVVFAEPAGNKPLSQQTELSSRKGLQSIRFFNLAISLPDINASVDWYSPYSWRRAKFPNQIYPMAYPLP